MAVQSRQHLNAWNIWEISLKLDNKPYKSCGIVVVYSINSSPQLFGEISANIITKNSSLWLSGSSWAVTTSRTWLHLQGPSFTQQMVVSPLEFHPSYFSGNNIQDSWGTKEKWKSFSRIFGRGKILGVLFGCLEFQTGKI